MASTEQLFLEGEERFSARLLNQSIDRFTRAGEEGTSPVNVYLNRGAAYFMIGELDWALKDFTRVLDIDADNERALYYRGLALLKKGKFIDAVEDLTRTITLDHTRGTAYLARAIAYAEVDCIDESLMDFKTAVALSGNHVNNFFNLLPDPRQLFPKTRRLLQERVSRYADFPPEVVDRLKQWLHVR